MTIMTKKFLTIFTFALCFSLYGTAGFADCHTNCVDELQNCRTEADAKYHSGLSVCNSMKMNEKQRHICREKVDKTFTFEMGSCHNENMDCFNKCHK